jgi:hypothetical protein
MTIIPQDKETPQERSLIGKFRTNKWNRWKGSRWRCKFKSNLEEKMEKEFSYLINLETKKKKEDQWLIKDTSQYKKRIKCNTEGEIKE